MDEKEKEILKTILKKIVEAIKPLDPEKGTFKSTPFIFVPNVTYAERIKNLYEKLKGGLI